MRDSVRSRHDITSSSTSCKIRPDSYPRFQVSWSTDYNVTRIGNNAATGFDKISNTPSAFEWCRARSTIARLQPLRKTNGLVEEPGVVYVFKAKTNDCKQVGAVFVSKRKTNVNSTQSWPTNCNEGCRCYRTNCALNLTLIKQKATRVSKHTLNRIYNGILNNWRFLLE